MSLTLCEVFEREAKAEVRKLRDKVYGEPSTDLNWDYTVKNWMRADSIAWLREKAKKPISEFLK